MMVNVNANLDLEEDNVMNAWPDSSVIQKWNVKVGSQIKIIVFILR